MKDRSPKSCNDCDKTRHTRVYATGRGHGVQAMFTDTSAFGRRIKAADSTELFSTEVAKIRFVGMVQTVSYQDHRCARLELGEGIVSYALCLVCGMNLSANRFRHFLESAEI